MAKEDKEFGAKDGAESTAGTKKTKRIWQSPKGPNCHMSLLTLQIVDINTYRSKVEQHIAPNTAGQYVVLPNAIQYDTQIEAMKDHAKKHKLYEIAVKQEGILPAVYEGMDLPTEGNAAVSTLKAELLKAEKANAELVRKLAEAEAKAAK